MSKTPKRRKRVRERMTAPKDSSVLTAAATLDEAHQRFLGLRLQLRAADVDIRRALAQLKRLTTLPSVGRLRSAYRPPRPQPAEAAEQVE